MSAPRTSALDAEARRQGWVAVSRRGGHTEWLHDGLALCREGEWWVIADRERDALPLGTNPPGASLWRWLHEPGGRHQRVFELPDFALDASTAASPIAEAVLAWVQATRTAHPSPQESPQVEEGLLAPDELLVRWRDQVVRGEVVADPGRIAVDFPLVATLPEGLSPSRRAWALEQCRAAERAWRWVQLGIAEEDATAQVRASVDLTGAPADLVPTLAKVAAACLRAAVAWAIPGLRALADPSLDSRPLSQGPRGFRMKRPPKRAAHSVAGPASANGS